MSPRDYLSDQSQPGQIIQISNELELNIRNLNARALINYNGLPIVPEVNPENIVELNISLADDVDRLNSNLRTLVENLIDNARFLGGEIYSGSSLIQDVSCIKPNRYRTTSLSEACARGLLDITSQQIVIGVKGEEFGIELFNLMRSYNPIFLALTNSSPYRFENNSLVDTGFQSRRIGSYEEICKFFPKEMLLSQNLESTDHHRSILQDISDRVLEYLRQGRLDENMQELTKKRDNGPHYPFHTLEPHQIYWMTRFRPDHANESSDFSIELRVLDIPTTITRMQAINSFVLGLCYYAEHYGFDLPQVPGDEFQNLQIAARYGTKGSICNQTISDYIQDLLPYSIEGLHQEGCSTEIMKNTIEEVLREGNCSEMIRRKNFKRPWQLIDYLVMQLGD